MTSAGFVMLHREHFPAYCADHGIDHRHRAVFEHLILEADWRTGVVEGFSLTHCSAELGLGTASGRRTLEARIRRLGDLGVIVYEPYAGRRPGSITVVDFHALSTPGSHLGARLSRGQNDLGARLSRGQNHLDARKARAQTGIRPPSPAVSRAEEVKLEEVKLASEREGSPTRQSWDGQGLETVLGPVLDFCRRTGKPGVTRRAGVIEALAPFTGAQIARAVGVLMAELRGATGGRIGNPIGVLVAAANRADVDYFGDPAAPEPVAAPVAMAAPAPTSSFGHPPIDRSDLVDDVDWDAFTAAKFGMTA